jgi:hypothetical protein
MTVRLRILAVLLTALAAVTAACDSPSDPGQARDDGAGPPSTSNSTGDATLEAGEDGPLEDVGDGSGVGERICAILTPDEIGALVGRSVAGGQLAGPLGSACSWDLHGDGLVLVQVTPPEYWDSVENPDNPSYQSLSGIGSAAFVQPSLVSGWTAAARYDDRMVLADVSGPTADPDVATRVLRGSVEQLVP